VVGRLARGADFESAQAELNIMSQRMAVAYPATHEWLRPRIVPYTRLVFDDFTGWETVIVRVMVALLLVVVSATVATLVYARTATRQSEIVVRMALGAGRRRIVTQLFVEALVLTVVAAALGLGVAKLALLQVDPMAEQFLNAPFWMDFSLSTRTIVYVAALSVLAAVVVGDIPALKATGREMQAQLRALGSTGLRFGSTWTALVVIHVTIAVAFLPLAVSSGVQFIRFGTRQPGFASATFLTARFHMDRETAPGEGERMRKENLPRQVQLQAELVRRIEADARVAAVIPLTGVPGQEPTISIEVEGSPPATGRRAGSRQVDITLFDALDVPIAAGRGFRASEADSAATAVVVNRSFVQQIMDGANPLGRRIRYLERDQHPTQGRWYEIVGVVEDFPAAAMEPDQLEPKVFHPLPAGQLWSLLAIRVRDGAPATFAGTLRDIAAALDPNILVRDIRPLDALLREEHQVMRVTAIGIAFLTLSVLLLSAAGIFALMSFTVAQRRREIGIRAALGANPRRLLANIFARALGQLGTGVLAGVLMAVLLARQLGEPATWSIAFISALIMAVGLFATILPARRGLRIQPTEALRSD
jgi:predicted permease